MNQQTKYKLEFSFGEFVFLITGRTPRKKGSFQRWLIEQPYIKRIRTEYLRRWLIREIQKGPRPGIPSNFLAPGATRPDGRPDERDRRIMAAKHRHVPR